MLDRLDSVVSSYNLGHYHEIFKDLTAWHIHFVVNNMYDDTDLKYIREKYSNSDLEKPQYYTEYMETVCIKPKIIAIKIVK